VPDDGAGVVTPGSPPADLPKTDPGPRTDQPNTRTVNLPGFRLSISQTGYFSSKEFEIDGLNLARNFLISFDVKSTRTEGSTRYGIAWNVQPDDFLLFTLHSIGPGAYSIGAGRSPTSPFLRFAQGSLDINAERDFDVLQMTKRGNALIFAVNRREVWRTTDYKLQSNRFAFWVADFSDAVMRSYTVQQ
jgi:hypothetical protein